MLLTAWRWRLELHEHTHTHTHTHGCYLFTPRAAAHTGARGAGGDDVYPAVLSAAKHGSEVLEFNTKFWTLWLCTYCMCTACWVVPYMTWLLTSFLCFCCYLSPPHPSLTSPHLPSPLPLCPSLFLFSHFMMPKLRWELYFSFPPLFSPAPCLICRGHNTPVVS